MATSSKPNSSSNGKKQYFNLHTTGIGYLNRIRTVTPDRGTPFLACTIAALNGPCEKPDRVYYDVKVSGAQADHLIRKCQEAVDAKSKVLLGFKLGDPWIDIFTYSKGEKTGKPGASLKGRLLYIPWIKIDGEEVYRDKSRNEDDSDEDSSVPLDSSQDIPESLSTGDDAEAPAEESEELAGAQ